MIDMGKLQGISYDRAHLFGMPNIGAEYADYRSGSHRLLDSECLICGRQATNAHHIVPRSVRKEFFVGDRKLRSPLFALCGSGTTGCHGEFHGGARYKVMWEWDSEDDEERWWSGELLDLYGPHSESLYMHGKYVIHDRKLDLDIHVRGVM